jgi:dCMP deaminase
MNWHEYFFNMIDVIKTKSKDQATKVGAIIVGKNHNVLSTGFNGFPRGVMEEESDLNVYAPHHTKRTIAEKIDKRHERPDKYLWTEHAERNAIYNAARHGVALDGATLYVDWIPCARCARAIIQSGIVAVVIDARDAEKKEAYWNQRWEDDMRVSKMMFNEANVKLVRYKE